MNPTKWVDRSWRFTLPVGAFANVLERIRGSHVRAAALVAGHSEEALGTRIDGQWSAKENIAHLDDLHELDEIRLQEFLEGAEVLTPADMGNDATERARHNETSMSEILERLTRHREDFVRKLETLDEDAISASARHARLDQDLRLIDWLYFVAEHDDHHLVRARAALTRASG